VGSFLQAAAARRGTTPITYHPSNMAFLFPRQFRELAAIGNQWRFSGDIQAKWDGESGGVATVIRALGAGQPACKPGPLPHNCTGDRPNEDGRHWCASFCVERDEFLRAPGRGGWHDPDQLLVGATPCSAAAAKAGLECGVLPLAEQQTQLAIWAISSAPLLLSADLKSMPADSLALLTNPGVLAIDQDPLGRMGFRFYSNATEGVDVWRKDLVGGDAALAIVNMGAAPSPAPGLAWTDNAPGIVFTDDVCGNVGEYVRCKGGNVAKCCQDHCAGVGACDAVNFKPGQCVLRNCSAANLTKAHSANAGWNSSHLAAPRPPAGELPSGFCVALADAGFAAETSVTIQDVFTGSDLGVHAGTFTTSSAIPFHGTMLLLLSFAPQYAYPEADEL